MSAIKDDWAPRVVEMPSAKEPEGSTPEHTEDALALQFSTKYADYLRYVAQWGRWLTWDGRQWQDDDTLSVYDRARTICRESAISAERDNTAARLSQARTVAAVEHLARSDRRHAATVSQWDADIWLLNTPAGVVHLRTGKLRPARREDYMRRIVAASPADMTTPLWMGFLRRIFNDDEALIGFFQRVCGYCLTGSTREHALFSLWGSGANGKSVLVATISGILGEYARTAPIEAFIASTSEHHPTDLAGLQGARLVTSVETEEGRRWAESKLKSLTGGDRIAARFMRQDFFEFTPQFKLVIAGNHKPGLRTVDEAIRRRLHLVPFTVTIPEPERDKDLADKLRAEWGGILQWMIDGCLAWQREGLSAPAAVRQATDDYMAGEDTLARWIDDTCVTGMAYWASSTALFASWSQWCEANHEHAGSQRRFTDALETHSYTPERTRIARGFRGLALRAGKN